MTSASVSQAVSAPLLLLLLLKDSLHHFPPNSKQRRGRGVAAENRDQVLEGKRLENKTDERMKLVFQLDTLCGNIWMRKW